MTIDVGAILNWIFLVLLVVVPALLIWRDPRTMRAVIASGFSASVFTILLLFWITGALGPGLGDDLLYLLLAMVTFALLVLAGIVLFLIWAGLVLVKRERASLPHLLSLFLGLGILAFAAALFYSDRNAQEWVPMLLGIGFPIFVFSFLLASYVLYSAIYGFVVLRWGKVGQAVVVLGTGLIGDRVPPLLAHRVDLGLKTFTRAQEKWSEPFLVFSGGQGSDEALSEAEAMNRYAKSQGLQEPASPNGEILLEGQSTTTLQNLRFSRELLQEAGCEGPWTTVTSNFHAFRAANQMSRLKIPGNAIGAKTKSYFWASAKLREFAAILVENRGWTIATVVTTLMPFVLTVFHTFFS